jgi:hypothetical protein
MTSALALLRSRLGSDDGVVTAFVVVVVLALVVLAGLVLDGGLALSAKVQAIDDAQSAARAGAQAIDLAVFRSSGVLTLDPATAVADAEAALAFAGARGSVAVQGDTVTVTATITRPSEILGLIGIDRLHESGTGSATAEQAAP